MTTNQYKMVPVDPTEEMVRTALGEFDFNDSEEDLTINGIKETYKAMLSAAPVIPSEEGGAVAYLVKDFPGYPDKAFVNLEDISYEYGMLTPEIEPLYTTPQPSPDAAARIAELERQRDLLAAGIASIAKSAGIITDETDLSGAQKSC